MSYDIKSQEYIYSSKKTKNTKWQKYMFEAEHAVRVVHRKVIELTL